MHTDPGQRMMLACGSGFPGWHTRRGRLAEEATLEQKVALVAKGRDGESPANNAARVARNGTDRWKDRPLAVCRMSLANRQSSQRNKGRR